MENFFDFEYSDAKDLIEKGVDALMKYKASENIDDYTVDREGLEIFENLIKFFRTHSEMNTFSVSTEFDPIIGCAYITAEIDDFYIGGDEVRVFGLLLSEASAFSIDCSDGKKSVVEITVPGVFKKKINP